MTTACTTQQAIDRHLGSGDGRRSAARRRRDAGAASVEPGVADLGFKAPRRRRGARRKAAGEAEWTAAERAGAWG